MYLLFPLNSAVMTLIATHPTPSALRLLYDCPDRGIGGADQCTETPQGHGSIFPRLHRGLGRWSASWR